MLHSITVAKPASQIQNRIVTSCLLGGKNGRGILQLGENPETINAKHKISHKLAQLSAHMIFRSAGSSRNSSAKQPVSIRFRTKYSENICASYTKDTNKTMRTRCIHACPSIRGGYSSASPLGV